MRVTHPYTVVQSPTHQTTAEKTVRWRLNRNMRRPVKNRKRERCSRVGNTSTAQGRCKFSTPSAKKARIRARLCGLYRREVLLMYRRAHCCSNVARRPHVRLMLKLKNQSEFTQIAKLGGVNGGGLASKGGIDMLDLLPLESARSR